MYLAKNDLMFCPLIYALSTINGKWEPLIIWHLSTAPNFTRRYGELKRCIGLNITHKMFSQQLKKLESKYIIERKAYDEMPLRVEYSLTAKGKSIVPILYMLRDWGVIWVDWPNEKLNRFICESDIYNGMLS